MSRSGYSEDCDFLELYRANVDRSIAGKRGQAFLREMAAAMDALPIKELIYGELVDEQGNCCAIGAVCKAKNLDISKVDYYEPSDVGNLVGISRSMAAEIEYMNDEFEWKAETPAERWVRMRKWIDKNLIEWEG